MIGSDVWRMSRGYYSNTLKHWSKTRQDGHLALLFDSLIRKSCGAAIPRASHDQVRVSGVRSHASQYESILVHLGSDLQMTRSNTYAEGFGNVVSEALI